MRNGKENDGMWYYCDELGDPAYCVVRFNKEFDEKKGKYAKTFVQWTNTEKGWTLGGPKAPKPLYNGHVLKNYPDAQIVIVEGEKCADALNKIFTPEKSLAISWMGGADAVPHANWSLLTDRDVIFWPDSDGSGFDTRVPMIKLLTPIVSKLKLIDVPVGDADAFDMNLQSASEFVSYATKYINVIKPYPQNVLSDSKPPKPANVSKLNEGEVLSNDLSYFSLQSGYPHMKTSSKGMPTTPYCTIENIKTLLEKCHIVTRYDVIKKEAVVQIAGKDFLFDTQRNTKLSHILNYATLAQIPQGNIPAFLDAIASEDPYNPVAEFISSEPWDGVSRLQELYDTVTTNDELKDSKELYMRKWLISAVAAAHAPSKFFARGVLVFQGEQNIGKTYWLKRLLPESMRSLIAEGQAINTNDKDIIHHVVSHWIVELGELDATFRKSDIAALKAFIAKESDTLRTPYARQASQFARRTVFFASVNPEHFLNDPTGSSRFWTIPVTKLDNNHTINMQQLWAEIKTIYDSGETWHLSLEQVKDLEVNNDRFQNPNDCVDILETYFDFSDDWRPVLHMTTTEIAEKCRIFGKSTKGLNSALQRLTKQKKTESYGGRKCWKLPALRIADSMTSENSLEFKPNPKKWYG